jgi:hypothetical protein
MTSQRAADASGGRLRRALRRFGSTEQELEDQRLQHDVRQTGGCSRIADLVPREQVMLAGTLKTVTLRPRSGTPALEAELYDGSGTVTLVWLGRRRIAGIEPGCSLVVEGRLGVNRGEYVIYNPRYELRA